MYDKYQATSNNFRLGFALSNRHHLHRAYLVTVRFHLILSVHVPNREKAAQPQPEAYPEIEILCLSLAPTKFLLNSCPVS